MSLLKKLKHNNISISDELLNSLDSSIRPLIKLCNDNGIKTFACCSGNDEEHLDKNNSIYGYFAFQDSKQARKLVANLIDIKGLQVLIRSAPMDSYEYYDQRIDKEAMAIYFPNKQGQSMQSMYDKVENSINNTKVNRDNLKLINSIIKKFREQSEFEYGIKFVNYRSEFENVNGYNCEIDITGAKFLDDKNVENVELLVKDIANILDTPDKNADIGRIYLPVAMGKNVLPALDLIKHQALSNKEKYSIAIEEYRKRYGESYEEEFEYLGYEEENFDQELGENQKELKSFETEMDEMFRKVSVEEIDELLNNDFDNKITPNEDFTI